MIVCLVFDLTLIYYAIELISFSKNKELTYQLINNLVDL